MKEADERALLEEYLNISRERFMIYSNSCGMSLDRGRATPEQNLVRFYNCYKEDIDPTYVPWREDELDYITRSPPHKKGRKVWSGRSGVLLSVLGFYFGESLVSFDGSLRWDWDSRDYLDLFERPIVSGFDKRLTYAPIVICQNLVTKISNGACAHEKFSNALSLCRSRIKS